MAEDGDVGGAAALCAPFLTALPVTGASISVGGGAVPRSGIAASDSLAARLDALQYDLGEGPSWETLRSGRPTLVPDVRAAGSELRWPVFAAATSRTAARALFAFPLRLHGSTIGVVDLYRITPGGLTATAVETAASLAARTAGPAAEVAARRAAIEDLPSVPLAPELRRQVNQAAGMILVQLDCSIDEALAHLRARAFVSGTSVEQLAREVVERRIDFAFPRDER